MTVGQLSIRPLSTQHGHLCCRACPNIDDVVADADMLVFCAPHQFMHKICLSIRGKGEAALSRA